MTRIWTGTADVVSGYTTVVLTGDPLTAANCPADATIVLAGATYFVADADYPTMVVELTRAYEGTDGTVSAEIDPMTPVTGSVVALAQDLTDYNARLALLEAYGKGLFYTILGQTGANDPGPGKVARDAAAWADVTAIYLDVLDAGGFDATPLIDEWDDGTIIIVRSLATRGYASFRLLSAPQSQETNAWRLLASLDYLGGDGALADGEDVAIEWNRVSESGLDVDATVAELADLSGYGGQASGFRVLVNDVGDGRAGVYTLDASGSPEEWVGPAYVTGPQGEGLGYDAHVATLADREQYEVQAPGYSVLVDDVGDGRAGIFTLIATGSPSDWAGPAFVTGEAATGSGDVVAMTDRIALKATDTTVTTEALLIEDGRSGIFVWRVGDYSVQIAADSAEGVYIKADAIASTAGAWVRHRDNDWLNVKHFGAVGDGTTDDTAAIQAAIDLNIGPVFFPPSTGAYICTSSLVVHNGTQLTGGSETGAAGASTMHQYPELRWTGTGTACVTGDDLVDYLFHGSISGLSFSTAAGATYAWIFDFYDLVGWTFKGINARQIDYTGGGILRCQETAPANPNWVNILYDFDFSVPTTGTQYLIDIVWTDSQISMGNLDGGKGAIYRGAGNVSTMGVQFNRTGTGYAGLTLRKETASNGQFMVSNCAFDACTTYGLIIDGSASPSGSIYAPAIVGCVFRNPGATADIQFISHASTVLSGPVIDACVFSEVAVEPVVVDEAWWRPTFGNNFYASGWVPFAPAASYDARNRIGAIGRNGINVLGLIAAKASKTVRGAANVAGLFGIEDANFAYALLGVKDGATPYVGASREADGDPTPLGIMVNNAIVAQFGTDLSFLNTGRIASSGATHGIGYSAGAGGTVTQATSKSTGVTLSKATGQITMNAAALAASTTVTFTLTNTAIEANDILVLNHRSGGTAGSYALNAQCAAGSATINVRNISGGSLSEAIVIGFALIKAVAA